MSTRLGATPYQMAPTTASATSPVTNYFYSSFTTTCQGGAYSVAWYLDGTLVGKGSFYDTAGVHFAQKLPTGWHSLEVISSCGQDAVKFYVQ